jgi:hypothetical protein
MKFNKYNINETKVKVNTKVNYVCDVMLAWIIECGQKLLARGVMLHNQTYKDKFSSSASIKWAYWQWQTTSQGSGSLLKVTIIYNSTTMHYKDHSGHP